MTKKWAWVPETVVWAAHNDQLNRNGGSAGVRDEGLLESALARPKNLVVYGEPEVFNLAAAYAFGIIRNHPYVDGNKRTGFLIACVFLEMNGWEFDAPEAEAYAAVMAFAQNEIDEPSFAAWLKDNAKKIKKPNKKK